MTERKVLIYGRKSPWPESLKKLVANLVADIRTEYLPNTNPLAEIKCY
jgi:hypothetical protein